MLPSFDMMFLHVQPTILRDMPMKGTRVPECPNYHDRKHQERVKYIHGPLVAQEIAFLAHGILDNPEYRTGHDQSTNGIECIMVFLPRWRSGARRESIHSFFKDDGRDDRQTEHNKLNDQSSNGDSLGRACHRSSHGHHAGSSALDQKRYHVTGNKGLGKPFDLNEGVSLSPSASDNSSKCHVNRSCQENRSEKDEYTLNGVWAESRGVVVAYGSSNISDNFDWW